MNPEPPAPASTEPGRRSGCWLRGCLILAMIVPTIMLIVLVVLAWPRLVPAG